MNDHFRRNLCIMLMLVGITLVIYWPVRNYDIIYYDDPEFVTESPEITAGVSWHSFLWAMKSVVVANWHPVTTFSFILTHQFFGINPGVEHIVNLIFHTANVALLFLVLKRMTGAAWRSAVAAAFFAWHPLRVESVTWISERKDVLFAFFMLLALLAYVRFVESKNKNPEARVPGRIFYFTALFLFVLGFMSKAMIVTLPFVFLLLDVWPLQRIQVPRMNSLATDIRLFLSQLKNLTLEKWPFFGLAVFFSGLTFWIQKTHAAVVSLERFGLVARVGHAVSSYVGYLSKMFWPAKLALIYPYPRSNDVLEVWLRGLLLLVISVVCLRQFFRRPYLTIGWFWYLGTAIPIIGLVQVGDQAMADRYSYIPLIGPVVALVWFFSELAGSSWFRRFLLAPATILLLAICIIQTGKQNMFWRNTISLFAHTIDVTGSNPSAQFCLAAGLEREGRLDDAITHYRIEGAMLPKDYRTYYSLANCFKKQGQWDQALTEYETVLASGVNPNDYIAHLDIAEALLHLNRHREAASHLDQALQIKPDSTEAMNDLAWILATDPDATIRDGARAMQLAERACELTGYKQTIMVGTLAAAYAEAGRFDDAIATAEKACALATESGEQALLQKNQELLKLYRAGRPFHDSLSPNPTGQ